MNTITVVGNLTRDPELRYTPTGQAVVKFGIAVNRFYVNRNGEKIEQTDFFNVNAWRSVAVNVAHHRSPSARHRPAASPQLGDRGRSQAQRRGAGSPAAGAQRPSPTSA